MLELILICGLCFGVAAGQQYHFIAGTNFTDTELINTPSPRCYHSASVDNQDQFYVFGGENSLTDFGDLWRLSVGNKSWTLLSSSDVATSTTKPRNRISPATWIDLKGNFWLYGGYGRNLPQHEDYPADLWSFNVTSMTWKLQAGSLENEFYSDTQPGSRAGMGYWTDSLGRMYIFGGYAFGEPYSSVWRFSPIPGANSWEWVAGANASYINLAGEPAARWLTACTNDPDVSGTFAYCFGGRTGIDTYSGQFADLWRLNQFTKTWQLLDGNTLTETEACIFGRPGPRSAHLLFSSKRRGGLTLMFGEGYTSDTCEEYLMSEVWHYQIADNSWSFVGQTSYFVNTGSSAKPTDRFLLAGGALSNDDVVVFGGYGFTPDYSVGGFMNDAWIYREKTPINCGAGYINTNNGCQPCQSGFYSTHANATVCLPCSAGQYSQVADSSCKSCPVNSFSSATSAYCQQCPLNMGSAAGSSSCACKGGFELVNGICHPCQSGRFKDSIGNVSCGVCPAGTRSGIGAAVCNSCPANTWSSIGSSTCSCDIGFGFNGSACVGCVVDTFKAEVGNSSCIQCPTQSFSAANAGSCTFCGENSIWEQSSRTCICSAGFEMSGTSCVGCKIATFKSTSGNRSCSICPENFYASKTGSTACIPCGQFSSARSGSASCLCNPGFSPSSSGACTPCMEGTYKANTGNSSCLNCPPGYTSPTGSTWCPNLVLIRSKTDTATATATVISPSTSNNVNTVTSTSVPTNNLSGNASSAKQDDGSGVRIAIIVVVFAAVIVFAIGGYMIHLRAKKLRADEELVKASTGISKLSNNMVVTASTQGLGSTDNSGSLGFSQQKMFYTKDSSTGSLKMASPVSPTQALPSASFSTLTKSNVSNKPLPIPLEGAPQTPVYDNQPSLSSRLNLLNFQSSQELLENMGEYNTPFTQSRTWVETNGISFTEDVQKTFGEKFNFKLSPDYFRNSKVNS